VQRKKGQPVAVDDEGLAVANPVTPRSQEVDVAQQQQQEEEHRRKRQQWMMKLLVGGMIAVVVVVASIIAFSVVFTGPAKELRERYTTAPITSTMSPTLSVQERILSLLPNETGSGTNRHRHKHGHFNGC
jgi:predicted nucleic acid-binding Zn ribbon protein